MACENAWMNFNWDDLRTVLALVRGKTLAAAALELGVNYTTVSRRIARIETAVGQPLFLRLADGYQPTEVAHSVAKHAVDMENAEHALSREMQGRDKTLNGTLTVTAPQLLIAHFLAPAIDQFCRENPHVTLRVRATNELLAGRSGHSDQPITGGFAERHPFDRAIGGKLCDARMGAKDYGYAPSADRLDRVRAIFIGASGGLGRLPEQ
jgi:DNA-binding transcriptional LysR family regulator